MMGILILFLVGWLVGLHFFLCPRLGGLRRIRAHLILGNHQGHGKRIGLPEEMVFVWLAWLAMVDTK